MTSPRSVFRDFLRAPDDPRIAGIGGCDACSFADRALGIPRVKVLVDGWLERYRTSDFRGITSDGRTLPDLFPLDPAEPTDPVARAPVAAMLAAVQRLLARASPDQQALLRHPIDAREWRAWMNPELYVNRYGLRLDEVDGDIRAAVLGLLQASLSPQGFERVRALMRVNHFLGELVGGPRVMNEFSYNVNLFGELSRTGPWGWNFYGHHLCLNCLVVNGRMVLSPVFRGAEPNLIDAGPWAGTSVLAEEERLGLALMRSLPVSLQRRAQLYRHKRDPAMPPGRIAVGDELHLAGAFQDNRVIPYEGVPVADFDPAARKALLDLAAVYLCDLPSGPFCERMKEVERHLPDTHLCWIGGFEDESPFYYRIQSPVVILEFDHHAGVFLGNAEPERFHIHTIVRTPNGNDYGMAWVRQHCERMRKAGT